MYYVQDLLQLAKELIGKTIYVGWPYLNEAMVHDGAVQYYQVRESNSTPQICYWIFPISISKGNLIIRPTCCMYMYMCMYMYVCWEYTKY